MEEIFCSMLGGKSKLPSSWNFMSFSSALFNLPNVSAAHEQTENKQIQKLTRSAHPSQTQAAASVRP